MMQPKIVHCFSGGLDSTVMLYEMLKDNCQVHCLFFQYGQVHLREWDYAKTRCNELGLLITRIDLPWRIFGSSILTNPGEHVNSPVVPNRNAVFLHIAAAFAVNVGAESVTIGVTGTDHDVFPDCREEFISSVNSSLEAAEIPVTVKAPYLQMPKKQIVSLGRRLKVPFEYTWSCYSRDIEPCGKCLACIERQKAFDDGNA